MTGDIWPGTMIEICRGEIAVTKPLRNCRFSLDKAAGKIVVEGLAAKRPQAAGPAG